MAGMSADMCRRSVVVLGAPAFCWKLKGHVGVCDLKWDGEEEIRRLRDEVRKLQERETKVRRDLACIASDMTALRDFVQPRDGTALDHLFKNVEGHLVRAVSA